MDFRTLLQSMNNISEATKEVPSGRIHTSEPGGYGRKDDEDEEGNKVKQDTAPRGRGRPKKAAAASGEDNKYDFSAFGSSGKDVKLPKWDSKKTVKHKLKDWIESIDTDMLAEGRVKQLQADLRELTDQEFQTEYKMSKAEARKGLSQKVDEDSGITVKPMPGASQIIGADGKPMGTADAATANTIKQAAEKGTLNLGGDDENQQMNEKWDTKMDTPASEKGKYDGKSKSELLKAYNHLKSTGPHKEGSKPYSNMKELAFAIRAKGKFGKVQEGAKPDFLDVDKDDDKKESFKKAVKDKEAKKKVEESLSFTEMMQEAGSDVSDMMSELQQDIDNFNKTGHCSDKLEAFLKIHGHSKKKMTGENIVDRVGFSTPPEIDKNPATQNPITTPAFARKQQSQGMSIKSPGDDKPFGFMRQVSAPSKTFESKDMKDMQLESWEKELNSLLTEGITVTSSQGQQGMPDSVSINATDSDAQELLSIVRQAGLGVFGGGDEQAHSGYGAPMSGDEGGTGTDPQAGPAVVGDGDDMMALIKKMSGIQSGPTAGFGDEQGGEEQVTDGPEGTMTPDYEEEDNVSDGEGEGEGEEKTDEGNAFSGAVAKAKQDGIQPGEKINVGGEEYPVKEEDDETINGNGKYQKAEGGSCNECGMFEARCVCSSEKEQVEEYANDAGNEEMAQLKHMLGQGNDLHRQKHSQAVGNPTQVTFETKLLKDSSNLLVDWKKLSGIK